MALGRRVSALWMLVIILTLQPLVLVSFSHPAGHLSSRHGLDDDLRFFAPPLPYPNDSVTPPYYTPNVSPYTPPSDAPPIVGTLSVLLIAAEFPDVPHTKSVDEIYQMFFVTVASYYREASFGQVSVTGKVVGWVTLPMPIASYARDCGIYIDDPNCDGAPETWWMVRDAVPLVNDKVNFYDYQYVVLVHAGNGEESTLAPDDVWSVAYLGGGYVKTKERTLFQFAIVPETEGRGAVPIGVMAHEFGHLAGLPDLYDPLARKSNLGPWELMDRGPWNGNPPGSSPAHFTSWSKLKLGWIPSSRMVIVNASMRVNVTLNPLENPTTGIQVIKIPLTQSARSQYYLVETRQRVGFDAALPSSGVLITYVDEFLAFNMVKLIDANSTTPQFFGAAWKIGRVYTDIQNSIAIAVTASSGPAFVVLVDRLGPAPELVADKLSADKTAVKIGDQVRITAVIRNQGSAGANSFVIRVYLDGVTYRSFDGSLAPGGSMQVSFTWNATAGSHVFRLVVDPDNLLPQLSRANKEQTITLTVGPTISVQLPNEAVNASAWVKVNGVTYTLSGSTISVSVLAGTSTVEVQSSIPISNGARLQFVKWQDGNSTNPRTVTVSTDLTIVAVYKFQYLLTVNANGGTATGGGWYDQASQAAATAVSPANVTLGKSRMIFTAWTGDVNSPALSITIAMNGPKAVVANWKMQYYLTVVSAFGSPSGAGWYDTGYQVQVSVSPIVDHGNGTRRIFAGWTGAMVASDPSVRITVKAPSVLVASWRTQFRVTVNSPYGDPSGANWYDSGTTATISVKTPLDFGNGTRRVFIQWTGDQQGTSASMSVTVSAPKVVTALWKSQYLTGFAVTGLPDNTRVTIVINGIPHIIVKGERYDEWLDANTQLQVSANLTVRSGIWTYRFVRWQDQSGNAVRPPFSVIAPGTYTALFSQSLVPGCFIATATYGSEVAPEVQFLRDFRDFDVLSTSAGSSFMVAFNAFYYSFSPTVAQGISDNEGLRSVMRVFLYPLIILLHASAVTYDAFSFSPEAAVVLAGTVASGLIGIIYGGPVAAISGRALRRVMRQKRFQSLFMLAIAAAWTGSLTLILLGEFGALDAALVAGTAGLVLSTLVVSSFASGKAILRLAGRLR